MVDLHYVGEHAKAKQRESHNTVAFKESTAFGDMGATIIGDFPNGTLLEVIKVTGSDALVKTLDDAHSGWVKLHNLDFDDLEKEDVRDTIDRIRNTLNESKQLDVDHKNYTSVIAYSQLPRQGMSVDDPQTEMAIGHKKLMLTRNSLELDNLMMCDDEFLRASVPPTSGERMQVLDQNLASNNAKRAKAGPIMQDNLLRENMAFFTEHGGVDDVDAQGICTAFSFYTGNFSGTASRMASLALRVNNITQMTRTEQGEASSAVNNLRMLTYYMTRGMLIMPRYAGPTTRMVLERSTWNPVKKAEIKKLYRPGNFIKWYQWASSTKGSSNASDFARRRVRFNIWSISGRDISGLSNFSKKVKASNDEEEVLFLPGTTFLVVSIREEEVEGEATAALVIDLRQVQLGLTQGSVCLWCDDNILDPHCEMRDEVHKAQRMTPDRIIKFILKPSTELAQAYLGSVFGQRLLDSHKARNTRFRIISDMSRPAPDHGSDAGAILVEWTRKQGLVCPTMIFTSSADRAVTALRNRGIADVEAVCEKQDGDMVQVTVTPKAAIDFIRA